MHERTVKKVKAGHYVATHGRETPEPSYAHANRGYWTDGEESMRAPSERTMSEYTITNERTTPPSNHATGYRHGGKSHRHHHSTATLGGRSTGHRQMDVHGGPRPLGPPQGGPPSRPPPRAPSALSYDHGGDTGSDIYITSAAYKAPSEISRFSHHPHSQSPKSLKQQQHHHQQQQQPSALSSGSHRHLSSASAASRPPSSRGGGGPRSLYSVASSAKTGRTGRSSRRAGAKVELMAAPNPFCPNVKGVCCLMVLLNLGLILVTLGFVIVIQFREPLFVLILGIIFLIFGFGTLVGSMIYCVVVCRDAKTPSQVRNEDLYWTKHWQKSIGYTPHEIDYKADRYDGYSDGYSIGKASGKFSHGGRTDNGSSTHHRY